MLTIVDNQLIAIKYQKQITLCVIKDDDRVKATAQHFGCSKAVAFLTIDQGLPIGKLLMPKAS